jgi:hypothetical protein
MSGLLTSIEQSQQVLAKLITNEQKEQLLDVESLSEREVIINAAVANGVAGLVAANCDEALFQNISVPLHKISKSVGVKLAVIDAHALSLIKALQDTAIRFIVLKGFALAHSLYSSSTLRQRADVDIIIDESDIDKVTEIFDSNGYKNPRGWSPSELVGQFSMRKILANGISVDFDIHTQLSNDILISASFTFDELLANSINLDVQETPVFNRPYALLHAILHMMHHRQHGDLIKLIWYYDIHLLIVNLSEGESESFVALCDKKGFGPVAIAALMYTKQYFDSKSLSKVQNMLQQLPFNQRFSYLLQQNTPLTNLFQELRKRGFSFRSFKLIQETLFPPIQELYVKYGDFPLAMAPFYYCKRIMLGSIKRLLKP